MPKESRNRMNSCVIIPIFNEASHLENVLNSFVQQTQLPDKLILVDDNSTDSSYAICQAFAEKYNWIDAVKNSSAAHHEPGKKVINAFYFGLNTIHLNDYDLIGKFDGDILLPPHYFSTLVALFESDEKIGIAGGNLYIEKKGDWIFEAISGKDKVRGPIKLYRTSCFKQIGGLKKSIGWDTVDGLLAQYYDWKIATDKTLIVKHLKPTGQNYDKSALRKQGETFYKLRYGIVITSIASAKLAIKTGKPQLVFNYLNGFIKAKAKKLPYLVDEKQGRFIRKLRWKKMRSRLF